MKQSKSATPGLKYNCFLLSLVLILGLVKSHVIASNDLDNPQNVRVKPGEAALLRCHLAIDDFGEDTVVWKRKRDDHNLTIGQYTYTSDARFSAFYHDNDWVLQISYAQLTDSGLYECRSSKNGVNVSNSAMTFLLNVTDPKQNQIELTDILILLNANTDDEHTKIQEIVDKAENILKRAEDKTGSLNPTVMVNRLIVDPSPVKDFNISESGGLTELEGRLRNMTIHGLKGLEITKMEFNLGLMELKVRMDIPYILLQGTYDIEGKVTFFPIYGDGNFWMNVSGVEIYGDGAFNRSENGPLEIGPIELDVVTSGIKLNFENLMGGGAWSGITNSVLNKMSGLIFNQVKYTMLDEVSHKIRTLINRKLDHLSLDFVSEKSSNLFDSILEYSTKSIKESGHDPLHLPPFEDKFNYNMLIFALEGRIKVFEGRLYGLSTLVRTGDIIATYRNNQVTFEARIGFTNLTGGYKWAADLMGEGPKGSASISLSSLSCYLKIKQSLKRGSPPTIDAFRIEKIKHLWIDVDGLGSWDFILEIVMNLVSNAFKLSLANAISGPVTHAIQKEINNMPISFL